MIIIITTPFAQSPLYCKILIIMKKKKMKKTKNNEIKFICFQNKCVLSQLNKLFASLDSMLSEFR